MKTETPAQEQISKNRKLKSRELTSRYLASTSTDTLLTSSPTHRLSPMRRKSTSTSRHRSLEDTSLMKALWPSSTDKKIGTLADHLGNDRLKDLLEKKSNDNATNMSLSRQRSCSEISSFEDEKQSTKENHKPIIGGSVRYTGKSASSSSKKTSNSSISVSSPVSNFVPGRFSVDERALSRNWYRRKSDSFPSTRDSESENSESFSGTDLGNASNGRNPSVSSSITSYLSSTVSSSKKADKPTKLRRGSFDSVDNSSPGMKRFSLQKPIKRANSLTGYGSSTSQWALSPGRSDSPTISVESKERPISFSGLKPPSSPSRAKGVGNLLTLGLDLFRSKKSYSSASNVLSPVGSGALESLHQYRLLYNRSLQWIYANAKVNAVNENLNNQAQSNLLNALDSLTKLRQSVLQKRLQLEKEKLEMKLNFIIQSQIKPLEAWGEIERHHNFAVLETKDCLHSVVCRVPLIEGAEVDPQSIVIALRHASELATSIKSTLNLIGPPVEKTVSLLSELAEVVAQERSLIEECLEVFNFVSSLE
ncbi:QWRF family, partial [Dillenia turbinata]